jgi:hypothetical protein
VRFFGIFLRVLPLFFHALSCVAYHVKTGPFKVTLGGGVMAINPLRDPALYRLLSSGHHFFARVGLRRGITKADCPEVDKIYRKEKSRGGKCLSE